VTRGDVCLARVGRKSRPVLVLTRPGVIDVRSFVTVAEVTISIRGLAAEVPLDHRKAGLERVSVINCDGLHTLAKSSLSDPIGTVDGVTMRAVCRALAYGLCC